MVMAIRLTGTRQSINWDIIEKYYSNKRVTHETKLR